MMLKNYLEVVQNVFIQGKSSRTISLNSNYLVCLKTQREISNFTFKQADVSG